MASNEPLSAEDFARWWKETGERELCQLLYWVWDPIGVSGSFPWAVDEYDGYATQVAQALRTGEGQAKITAMLYTIEEDRMGLGAAARESSSPIARRILHWYEQSQRHWVEFGPLQR
jgi:hypothetical protein